MGFNSAFKGLMGLQKGCCFRKKTRATRFETLHDCWQVSNLRFFTIRNSLIANPSWTGVYVKRFHSGSVFVLKVKWSRYRPGVAQRVGRVIALLFHYRGTRRGWVVSSTPWPHFTSGKDPVPILHEAGWAPWPVWTGGKSHPHRDSFPDRPAHSQSLYRLSYRARLFLFYLNQYYLRWRSCLRHCATYRKARFPLESSWNFKST